MSKNKNSNALFSALWPTTFLQDTLPGAENANIILVEMIEEMDARAADMTTDYLQGDFLANTHPVIVWLKDCIRGGSVCLNSFWTADKWISAPVMLQPGLVAVH